MKMVIGKKLGRQENVEAANASFSEMMEIKSKRGQRSKVFSDGHRRMKAEFYDKPVHYYDVKNGEFEEIDTRFHDDGEMLETRANTFRSKFYKRLQNGKVFEMEKDSCKVGLKSIDAARCGVCNMEACECSGDKSDGNKVLVKNVKANTDIEYVVDSERVKENIIVKERAEKYEYDFDLELNNLTVGVSEDGKSLELTKKDSGRLEFYIPSPVMFDANGESSEDVYYEIEQDNYDNISIKVIANADWINSSDRAFPVTIDPQIVTASFYGAYYYSSGYDSSIFRYEVVDDGQRKSGDLKLYYNASTGKNIYSEITILKNKLPSYIRNNFNNVSLKLKAKSSAGIKAFSIGYSSFSADGGTEFTADVTSYFYSGGNEIVIPLSNAQYRGMLNENDIEFCPPTLLVEYDTHVEEITVTRGPNKTSYLPGEKFDKSGMVVTAKYDDNSTKQMSLEELEFEPYGTLATYDKNIKITYKGEDGTENIYCYYTGIKVENGDYWFNDRRSAKNLENVYRATLVNNDGSLNTASSYLIKLEHDDGVSESDHEGTPLNAQTFNKIIKVLKEKDILE